MKLTLVVTLLLLGGCENNPELDSWRKVVAREPSENYAGLQVDLCRHPPPGTTERDLKRCQRVILPAIVALARDRIEHPSAGMDYVVACPLLRRALPEGAATHDACRGRQ